uniref:Uncharacterized protein n=1 Tax=Anguilla anguilla TaxID=7936 RepID=A0A0E9SRN2_ANGAN
MMCINTIYIDLKYRHCLMVRSNGFYSLELPLHVTDSLWSIVNTN